jgi:hypothetical protein
MMDRTTAPLTVIDLIDREMWFYQLDTEEVARSTQIEIDRHYMMMLERISCIERSTYVQPWERALELHEADMHPVRMAWRNTKQAIKWWKSVITHGVTINLDRLRARLRLARLKSKMSGG